MNLDDTDRALLAAMLEDARISQRALARKVGIAQGTVLNRIRRMENMGLIKGYSVVSVSYTHLTLPTILLV